MQLLLSEVAEAFPPVLLNALAFGEYASWDSYPYYKEFENASQGRTWDMLGPEFVETHFAALGFMNARDFVAVLPAYLAALLLGKTQNQMAPLLFSHLTRKESTVEKFDARIATLTHKQRMVIARILAALSAGSAFSNYKIEIASALNSWSAYLKP